MFELEDPMNHTHTHVSAIARRAIYAGMGVTVVLTSAPAVSLMVPTVAIAETKSETGTLGTCQYTYDDTTKMLTLGAGTLPDQTDKYESPLPHAKELKSIKFTGDVTLPANAQGMFAECSGLTSLDLTQLKTGNVTNMGGMFSGCSGLTSLDLTPLKTDNVTDMRGMFYNCSGLTSLNLTPLKTDNVTDISSMFAGCSGLTSLDLSSLKTDNVTSMSNMFYNCSGLTSLDLTPLKTDNVTDMQFMFFGCSGLTSLDLTPLKTGNVTNMGYMFSGCSGLTSLRTGDTFGIKAAMSDNRAALPKAMTMDGTTAMTSNAHLVDGAHYYLTEGTALPDAWKPQHATETGTVGTCPYTYDDTTKTLALGAGTLPDQTGKYESPLPHAAELKSIKFTGDVTLPANSQYMFYECSGLTSLDLTPLKTDNVTNMTCMFFGCSGLTSLDLTPLKTDNVKYMSCMFYNCPSLTSLDLTPLKTGNVTNMSNMFSGCSGLTSLRTGDTFGVKATSKATLPKAMIMDSITPMKTGDTLADGAHYYLTEGTALPDAWKPQHVTYDQKFDSKDSTWSSDSDIHDGKVHLFYSTLGGKWQDPGQDATVDTDNHDHDNGTYLVTIPTKIAYENMNIGKVDTSDTYTVNVRGAIEDGQTVTVTAETQNKLKNGTFEDITETTTQGRTTWTSDEVFNKLNADGSVAGTDTTDTVKMSGEVKAAGKYEGTVGYSAKLS